MSLKDYLRQVSPPALLKTKRALHRRLTKRRLQSQDAVILQPRGKDIKANHTFVVACGPYFDQRVPNAAVSIRLGFARGFEQIGLPYELVSLTNLRRLRDLPDPIIFMSENDFEFLGPKQVRELRRYRKLVWVSPWFEGSARFYEEHGLDLVDSSRSVRTRVLESNPDFVCTPVNEWGLEYFKGWDDQGQRLISLPLACDTMLYDRYLTPPRFSCVEIAFVGGYWPYKARNFDLYLKPHEDKLTVFGYSKWPYAGYGGELPAEDEPVLYRDAILAPAINEPHAEFIGDICERVYKVLGSGGLCITDVTVHRGLFSPEELLVPTSVDEYHDMVHSIFRQPEAFSTYREKGYRAIRERHTYAHRAQTILKEVGLEAASDMNIG